MTQKAQNIKEKNYSGLFKIKTFCSSKDTTNKVKRQPTKRQKIFTIHIFDEKWYPEYTNNSYNSIRQTTHFLKIGNRV